MAFSEGNTRLDSRVYLSQLVKEVHLVLQHFENVRENFTRRQRDPPRLNSLTRIQAMAVAQAGRGRVAP